ncbi:radical SAM protein [Bacillus spizizenii]|nr:radical SAM protein [Bacillus spizizenii]
MENNRLVDFFSDRTQKLILMPTEKCNFRCTYCYEDYQLGRMTKETIKGIKNLISRRVGDLEQLYISWFGGEPLVAKDIVLDISKFTHNITQKYKNLEYRAGMTTNGYTLTPKLFENLTKLKVLDYQISLDGPEEIHNETRIKANGEGTYKAIWDNLLSMKEVSEPFSVILRVHVTPNNVSGLDSLISDLKREFIDDTRFKIIFKAVGHLGGENDGNFSVLTGEKKYNTLAQLEKKLQGNNTKKDLNYDPYVCYAAKPNSLIIRSDGSIAKCTVALYEDFNKIGYIRSDGTLNINQKRLTPWFKGFENFDYHILECPIRGISK